MILFKKTFENTVYNLVHFLSLKRMQVLADDCSSYVQRFFMVSNTVVLQILLLDAVIYR